MHTIRQHIQILVATRLIKFFKRFPQFRAFMWRSGDPWRIARLFGFHNWFPNRHAVIDNADVVNLDGGNPALVRWFLERLRKHRRKTYAQVEFPELLAERPLDEAARVAFLERLLGKLGEKTEEAKISEIWRNSP